MGALLPFSRYQWRTHQSPQQDWQKQQCEGKEDE
jgi:hypothetical protein